MSFPAPDTTPMQDWERRLWTRHDGAWTSHYTIYDADQKIVDQYHARNDMVSDFATGRYFQRNLYRRGSEVEARRFKAHFQGRSLIFEGGTLLEGHAHAVDSNLVLLRFQYLDKPFEVVETINLLGDESRARTMQQAENGVLKRVTAVFGETRILAEPGVDVEGNDLYPITEEWWHEQFPQLG